MSKDIKKALEHCIEWNCVECPNREELGSGETVCRGRLLPDVLEYVADLEAKLAESEEQLIAMNEKSNKIKKESFYLKQQLAESEKLTERLQQIVDKLRDKEFAGETLVNAVNSVYEPLYQSKCDEVEELKQQLAEKEKIEYTDTINFVETSEPDIVAKELDRLNEQLAEKNKEIEKLNACVDFYKSYYISFKGKVIDELEKVKRYIDDKAYYVEEENFGIEINEYIDNQIEGLKKEMK